MIKKTIIFLLVGLHILTLSEAFGASKSSTFQVSCIVPQQMTLSPTASDSTQISSAQGFQQEEFRQSGGNKLKLVTVTA